jgi:hypothetical protein
MSEESASVEIFQEGDRWRVAVNLMDGNGGIAGVVADQTYPTKEAAHKAFLEWCAMIGIEPEPVQ